VVAAAPPAKGAKALDWLATLEDPRLGRVFDLMLGDPARPHTLESLAEAAGMSRSAFAERLGEVFGRTPMTLLHAIRMEQATKLLAGSTLAMEAVARRAGFASRSHFSRASKEHHGMHSTRRQIQFLSGSGRGTKRAGGRAVR